MNHNVTLPNQNYKTQAQPSATVTIPFQYTIYDFSLSARRPSGGPAAGLYNYTSALVYYKSIGRRRGEGGATSGLYITRRH